METQISGVNTTVLYPSIATSYHFNGSLTIEFIVSVGVPVPESDVQVAPGVHNSSYSEEEEEDDGCNNSRCVAGAVCAHTQKI